MAEIRVRNLNEWVVDEFRARAKRHGKSLEGELRELLSNIAQQSKLALSEELRSMRFELRRKYGTFSDSVELIREDRDARG